MVLRIHSCFWMFKQVKTIQPHLRQGHPIQVNQAPPVKSRRQIPISLEVRTQEPHAEAALNTAASPAQDMGSVPGMTHFYTGLWSVMDIASVSINCKPTSTTNRVGIKLFARVISHQRNPQRWTGYREYYDNTENINLTGYTKLKYIPYIIDWQCLWNSSGEKRHLSCLTVQF